MTARRWLLLLALVCSTARADSEGAGAAGETFGEAPLACYLDAQKHTHLSEAQALELCTAAPSVGPARCYIEAQKRLVLSEQQALELCKCADSSWPVSCFEVADRKTFLSDQQIITNLCSPTAVFGLIVNCQLPGEPYAPPPHIASGPSGEASP